MGQKHRIIVIEDQEDLAELYRATISAAGYAVYNAYTGEEGVAEFRANGADAILLDITLPEMQGTEALREIRHMSSTVPVIVVTGESHKQLREQCERLGVQDYLPKPVDYDALLKSIEQAVKHEPEEEYEVVTLRLPKRLVEILTKIDGNLERAVMQLCDEKSKTESEVQSSKFQVSSSKS